MKYKHENTIRNISMFTLIIILILGKLGKIQIQIMLGVISFIGCTFSGVYCVYKGLKLGGAFMFCISFAEVLVFLSYYYNSYILSVPIPGMLAVMCIIGHKLIALSEDKEKVKRIRRETVIGAVLFSIAQVVMITLAFIK